MRLKAWKQFTSRALGQLRWRLSPSRSKQTKSKEASTNVLVTYKETNMQALAMPITYFKPPSPTSVQISFSVWFSLPPARGAKLSGCTAPFRWRMYQTVPPRSDLGWRRGFVNIDREVASSDRALSAASSRLFQRPTVRVKIFLEDYSSSSCEDDRKEAHPRIQLGSIWLVLPTQSARR